MNEMVEVNEHRLYYEYDEINKNHLLKWYKDSNELYVVTPVIIMRHRDDIMALKVLIVSGVEVQLWMADEFAIDGYECHNGWMMGDYQKILKFIRDGEGPAQILLDCGDHVDIQCVKWKLSNYKFINFADMTKCQKR